jgi:hypothetical protein
MASSDFKKYGFREQTQPVVISKIIYDKMVNNNIQNLTYFVSRSVEKKLNKNELTSDNIRIKLDRRFVRIEKPIYDKLNELNIKNVSNYIGKAIEENLDYKE